MVPRDNKQLARESKVICQTAKPQAKPKVSPLRERMIRDMELAGYTPGTRQTYIGAVVKLQDHYQARPDRLSEKQVQQYILWLRDEKGIPKGTFQTSWYGLKFLYYRTPTYLCQNGMSPSDTGPSGCSSCTAGSGPTSWPA